LAGSVNWLHYVLILCIPMTATILYSFFLSFNVVIPTNQVVYAITTPLGFIMLVASIIKIFKRPMK
ncbi:MAG: hypothetical protein PVG65_05400, partial [Candidatus Thorarchaeota archaeon]